jgi:5-(carboxyamino)imidazole ribonucleotide synthase
LDSDNSVSRVSEDRPVQKLGSGAGGATTLSQPPGYWVTLTEREQTTHMQTPGTERRPIVAVLGGGQLGRMLGIAGAALGVELRFLDPSPDATARALGDLIVGELGDEAALARVATGADVVTYEWEGVPADGTRAVAATAPVRPDPVALEVAQDRVTEKETFVRLGIDVARFAPIDGADDVSTALETVGLPAVVKTRRGGYDGKGQRVVRTVDDARDAWDALGAVPLVAEALVPFDRELSVLAARAVDGTTACYPLVENEHSGGILRTSYAPARGLTAELQASGESIATRLLDDLGYVGVLAVELFECDGELLANEMAPRVHNSGHWTIEGADTSQFEQHLRAVLGWPLGRTDVRRPSAMVNCIGRLPDAAAVLAVEGTHLHDYEKSARPGRKVGHITVVADDDTTLAARVAQIRAIQHDDG